MRGNHRIVYLAPGTNSSKRGIHMGQNLDRAYSFIAILWLIAGVIFGTWLGGSENDQVVNVTVVIVGAIITSIGIALFGWMILRRD